jgi:cephalosporin hydroxylase
VTGQGSLVRRVRRVVKAVVHPSIAPLAVRTFRSRAAACKDPVEALRLAESFDFGRIRITPMQVPAEITAFLEVLAARPPRTILEIGTADGGTLFLFTRVAARDALLLSLDLPKGPDGYGYPPWKWRLYRSFARSGQRIELIRADSHDPATRARIAARLGGREIDLLFIDGDHSYAGVRSDYELYAPLVGPSGIVAFHDIVPGPETGGVPRFWQELRGRPGAREIVADWGQGGYGIGWFPVGHGEERVEAVGASR